MTQNSSRGIGTKKLRMNQAIVRRAYAPVVQSKKRCHRSVIPASSHPRYAFSGWRDREVKAKGLFNGGGQGALDGPAAGHDSLKQGQSRETSAPRPFRQGKRQAVMGEAPVLSLIVGLFGRSGPSAVAGLVSARVVNAVDTAPFGTWPHVAQERLERIAPFRTHPDPLCAVLSVSANSWIVAAPFSRAPRRVFEGMRASMRAVAIPGHVTAQAATTLRNALHEVPAKRYDFVTTFTATVPSKTIMEPRFIGRSLDDRQPAKLHSGNKAMHAVPLYQFRGMGV